MSDIETERRGEVAWIRLNRHSLVMLGYGVNQKRIQATVTSQTSSSARIAKAIATVRM